VDASNAIVAIELLVAMADLLLVRKFLASYLVGSIGTIVITIASPSRRYAIILGTREISARMTSCRPTSFLVAVISAIIIVVAHPELLDTVLIRAGELVGSASVVVTILLVQTAGAIYLVITHPALRDAFARTALEFRFVARLRSADCRILVGAIRTISVAIAMPYIRYASAVGALEV
jgi:hypothetical protein